MTEVVINTEDISEETTGKIDDTVSRVERLEMADQADSMEKAIRDDELATRLRALEVRMEHQQAAALSPEETTPDPEPVTEPIAEPDVETEPETVEDDPEEDVPDVPDSPVELPDDPTERPELNPQGAVNDVIEAIAEDKPKRGPRKPKEETPTTKKDWRHSILGGSGGSTRRRRKAKAGK